MCGSVGADATENGAASDSRAEEFAEVLRGAGYDPLTVKYKGSTVVLVDKLALPLSVALTERAHRMGLRYDRCTTEMHEEPGYVAYVPREVAE